MQPHDGVVARAAAVLQVAEPARDSVSSASVSMNPDSGALGEFVLNSAVAVSANGQSSFPETLRGSPVTYREGQPKRGNLHG
jgi:hypothetical protein